MGQFHPSTDLRYWYESAFKEFATRARELQQLRSGTNPEEKAIAAALVNLATARTNYSRSRDLLAFSLLFPAGRHGDARGAGDPARVRKIAELLWELEGKREGQAEHDWYRAEQILQFAAAR